MLLILFAAFAPKLKGATAPLALIGFIITAWAENLVRAGRAAGVQLEALRKLKTGGALDELDDRLREAAELRLRNPTLSLRELAARADPPATKAGMQRRLARLVELADG